MNFLVLRLMHLVEYFRKLCVTNTGGRSQKWYLTCKFSVLACSSQRKTNEHRSDRYRNILYKGNSLHIPSSQPSIRVCLHWHAPSRQGISPKIFFCTVWAESRNLHSWYHAGAQLKKVCRFFFRVFSGYFLLYAMSSIFEQLVIRKVALFDHL